MNLRVPFFVILCLFATAVSAAPARFSLIKGQSAYEVLGLPPSATDAEIRATWTAKVKKVHTDVNTNAAASETIKNINAAYECLKSKVREAYDSWLQSTSHAQESSRPHTQPRTDDEEIELTYNYILRAGREDVAGMQEREERLTVEALASAGRFRVTYCLRYMPGTTFTPEQLSDLILHYALALENDSDENRMGNFSAALGAITYLKEMLDPSPYFDFYRASAKMSLRRLENSMVDLIRSRGEDAYTRMITRTLEYMTERPYKKPAPPARQKPGCEQHLETTVEVQGRDGRWYKIPVKVEVKLGH